MNEGDGRSRPNYVAGNVRAWQIHAKDYERHAEAAWSGEPHWGIWEIPEREVGLLPEDMTGMACLEVGCGTGYVSAWMRRRGATVVGIDPTVNQLSTARRLANTHGLAIEFLEGIGESLPLDDASQDFVISEYGAALWSDPHLWIPEAVRVLRPGGVLTFLTNSVFVYVCAPALEADGPTRRALLRPYLGMHRITFPDAPEETEFHLAHGDWVTLLRASGLSIERLIELGAPPGATSRYAWADPVWARDFPTEEVWVCRKA